MGEHSGDLSHGDLERIARRGQVVARGGQDADASSVERHDPDLLHDQLAGQPGCVLDDDGKDPVGLDSVEEGGRTPGGSRQIAGSRNSSTISILARRAKARIAALCRGSDSLSGPTFVDEDVLR